jgi:RNA-directed DNA polymerase
MQSTKSFNISKELIWQAWLKVKSNQGASGVDGISISEFESDLKKNLYKLWNRMSSGSYFPSAVRQVMIPKPNGGERPLGIPTVSDRVAQMAVVLLLEPLVDSCFHTDSYGYRPGKSAHQAIAKARQRCWKYDWVLDIDIKKFFDTIDHDLLIKAVKCHSLNKWVLLYLKRWLTVPYQRECGEKIIREKGVPQGSVIGPLLANLFMHYVFDKWMDINHPDTPFERYADDIVCHCQREQDAQSLKLELSERFKNCGLALNEEKTKIVYCKDSNRKEDHKQIAFDFLGFTFRPRKARNKRGEVFTSFTPAISNTSRKRITQQIRQWWKTSRTDRSIEDLANWFNPKIQGWINYYGKFYKSSLYAIFQSLNRRLAFWITKKFKKYRRYKRRGMRLLGEIALERPKLFAHWQFGILPSDGGK